MKIKRDDVLQCIWQRIKYYIGMIIHSSNRCYDAYRGRTPSDEQRGKYTKMIYPMTKSLSSRCFHSSIGRLE